MSDRIRLSGVRGRGFHGVFEHERREGQEFVVDVELTVDLAAAGSSDDLADTVNYGEVGAAVLARIEGEPHDLIERLAELIASDALSHSEVDEVTVTVHKPQAPVGVPFGDVTVAVTRRRAPVPVVVAVGANLPRGEHAPADTVHAALDALSRHPGVAVVTASGLHETDPVGGPDQPVYVNAVVTARTSLSPTSLLRELHAIEAAFDRRREVRWGARTLDLDLVQYGDPASGSDVTCDRPHLALPHPRAHERAFVLVPWLEAEPAAVLRHDGRVVAVSDLVTALDTDGVRAHPTGGPPEVAPDVVPEVAPDVVPDAASDEAPDAASEDPAGTASDTTPDEGHEL
jgi:dihydroneopterin aldolase / 2-amino-4-hydroxy-6-hydroxymethyldihydropteridine diphosphokinase